METLDSSELSSGASVPYLGCEALNPICANFMNGIIVINIPSYESQESLQHLLAMPLDNLLRQANIGELAEVQFQSGFGTHFLTDEKSYRDTIMIKLLDQKRDLPKLMSMLNDLQAKGAQVYISDEGKLEIAFVGFRG